MNVRILCVGKLKEKCFLDACAEYEKRLSRFYTLSVQEVADEKAPDTLSKAEEAQVRDREGERLLRLVGEKDFVTALCLDGREVTSEQFAESIRLHRDGGVRTLTFLIGGSLGLSDAAIARADAKLSLGKMTLPHRIARLVLEEQLFRAAKILAGETYHK